MKQLVGKRAIITGASKGIGRAMCEEFAERGADVVAVARSADLLGELTEELRERGQSAEFVVCDVTDPEQVSDAAQAIISQGPVDVLVTNAGGNSFSAPLSTIAHRGWTKTQKLNVDSTLWWIQAVLGSMQQAGRGSIITVSSVAGLNASPLMSHYGAAKAAVISMTKSVAVEVAHAGIRVNALVPGWVETDLTEFLRQSESSEQALLSRVPMGRWGQASEIARAAAFLASDDASFMTGQVLVCDGGLSVMP